MSKKKDNGQVNELLVNNVQITDDYEIAENFNEFFSTVGTKIANSLPEVNVDPMQYVVDHDNIPSLQFEQIGPVFVSDVIKSFAPKKSIDMDGMSMYVLKYVESAVCTPLAHIFNLSFRTGIFPSKLKINRVTPIFKSGDPKMCDNYRPISLANTFSKVLEKIVAVKLTNHLDLNKLIDKYQFGFQKGLSTEHNLIHLTNYVSEALNSNKFCMGVFLDIKKAFDCVPHDILIRKLEKLGIIGVELDWFRSYLDGRSQCVEINGKKSRPRKIKLSVMQGSILGPLLFLCFINDLCNVSDLLKLLFADDTCALHADLDLNNLVQHVNAELQKIALWFAANKLAVNVKKCKFILFHNKGKKIDENLLKVVYNSNNLDALQDPNLIHTLDRISKNSDEKYYKYLGVLLDENLNFNSHIDYTCNKLSKSLFCLNRLKNFVNKKALISAYHSLIGSHLLYCINILGCASQQNINRLHIIQKKAIRIVCNLGYNEHTAASFCDLQILPFDKLVIFHKLLFMHSIRYEYAPRSFINIWKINSERNVNYNLRNFQDFDIKAPHYEGFKKYPIYSFPFEWNRLDHLKLQSNRVTFKIELKNKLLMNLIPPTPH
jgi:hypothetical protein